MTTELEWIAGGGVTSPAGFSAGAVYTGIKSYGAEPRLDVGLLVSDSDCTMAGVFTRNAVLGEPVKWNKAVLAGGGTVRALFANSGVSNTANGEQGTRDNERIARLVAERLGIEPGEVLTGSTGVIGINLPMDLVERGIAELDTSPEGGGSFSRSIMTTDTVQKEAAVRFTVAGVSYTVGGCAKGSGMIHPDMATMFGFITTDAPCDRDWLQATLAAAVDVTFNMIDVDMDTSTSDTALLLANGRAGGDPIDGDHPAADALAEAVGAVARRLARALARDGEGAKTLIEGVVQGARTVAEARMAARTLISSPLVKTMVTGRDPNWGRVMMAVGRSGAAVDQTRASVWVGDYCVLDRGTPTGVDLTLVSQGMDREEVVLRADLGSGEAEATAWGCDLTVEYVHINADYTT